jgi:hypothetical protein
VKLLLDTATFLWLTYDASKISPAARAAYADLNNEPHLSVISIWEIIVKNRLGKLPLPLPIDELIAPASTGREHGNRAIDRNRRGAPFEAARPSSRSIRPDADLPGNRSWSYVGDAGYVHDLISGENALVAPAARIPFPSGFPR